MIIIEYSNEQKAAILHTNGPALVLAGPGSGKTHVVIQRLESILKIDPAARILSLTFSNAATIEMSKRFEKITGNKNTEVSFSTVHSLGFSILKKGYKSASLPHLITNQKGEILKTLYFDTNNTFISDSEIETLISSISRYRYASDTFNPNNVQIKNFPKIYELYCSYKKDHNLIDFDDMIFMACDILQNNPAEKSFWAKNYDYIQVDEAQDLTRCQFDIIQQIAPHKNIFVVADDDQSIYGFRGAMPSCLFEFVDNHPGCKKFYLSKNFRSVPAIVNFSKNIIEKNSSRFEKSPVAESKALGKIKILHAINSLTQGKYIALAASEASACEKIGILYRNNRSALAVATVLIHFGISFYMSGSAFPLPKKYIDLFVMECLKVVAKGEKASLLFRRVVANGFEEKHLSKKKNCEHEKELINASLDFLNCVFCLSDSLNQALNLIELTKKAFADNHFTGGKTPQPLWLSSIHSAKGLEYDTVFLIDINRDEFPGKSSVSGPLLEEERRLLYVAVTRAKKNLYLFYSEKFGCIAQEESLFISEARSALKGG